MRPARTPVPKSTPALLLAALAATGCVTLPMGRVTDKPPERPEAISRYYEEGRSYSRVDTVSVRPFRRYTVHRIVIATPSGEVTVDYFKRKEPSPNLVLVFPALGGKNLIENYFSDYFADAGFEAAIVHRQNDFKDPAHFGKIEEVLRTMLVRDRIVMDYFEREHGKKNFGSFGLSRGAINVSMTAGVDPRLRYNVMVLGGTDLIGIFEASDQPRIRKYVRTVAEREGITTREVYARLRRSVRTDPKYLASYLNPNDTLLVLSAFDRTVPFKYGLKLRRQIGYPRTLVLLADHYLSVLYTQMVKVFPPEKTMCVFPFDYIEARTVDFYREKFLGRAWSLRNLPLRLLQLPADGLAALVSWASGERKVPPVVEVPPGSTGGHPAG